jgi:MscS family membrane protein
MMNDFLKQTFLSNSLGDYLILFGMILFTVLFKKIISKYLSNLIYRLIQKHVEGIESEKLFALLYKPISLFILLIIFLVATSHIEFPAEWNLASVEKFGLRMILHRSYLGILVISVSWIALRLIDFGALVLLKKAEKTESKQDDQIIAFAKEFAKVILIILSFFFILGTVFNVDIGAIIAGLGIGGLALALAAKESLENLLASFTIFFDQPFVVGDLVQVGNITGTVEKVGFRSTRIRTLEKSFLTIPNKKMVDSELDNLTLRTFRRVKHELKLAQTSSQEQIMAIVQDLQYYIDHHPHTNQEGKISFWEFGNASFNIMVQYFVDTMDMNVYLEVKQDVNLKIMEIINKHNANFAAQSTSITIE